MGGPPPHSRSVLNGTQLQRPDRSKRAGRAMTPYLGSRRLRPENRSIGVRGACCEGAAAVVETQLIDCATAAVQNSSASNLSNILDTGPERRHCSHLI